MESCDEIAQSHSISAATTTPAAMTTAVAGAIATAIAATAVAAFPGGMSLPALAVPVVFGVVAVALTHPWLVIEKPTISYEGRLLLDIYELMELWGRFG
jgi:hypothetical protein